MLPRGRCQGRSCRIMASRAGGLAAMSRDDASGSCTVLVGKNDILDTPRTRRSRPSRVRPRRPSRAARPVPPPDSHRRPRARTRGKVVVTHEYLDRASAGEYGRLARRWSPLDADVPTAVTVQAGEPWPFNPETHTARRDVEFIRKGMPVHGPLVWLSERRYRWLLSEWEITCPSVLRWVFPPPASRYDETAAEL
jgi:hypothetical protein